MRLIPCRRLLVVSICAAACLAETASPVSAGAPAPAGKPGWTTYEKKASHFSIALPASWNAIEMDAAYVDASLDAVSEKNPALGRAFGPQARLLVKQGIKFLAVDSAVDLAKVGFATNVNVLTEKMPAGIEIEDNLKGNVAQLKALAGARVLEEKLIVVDGRKAGYVVYRLMIDPAAKLEAAITQVYLLVEGDSLIVTFTTLPSQSAHYDPLFAEMIARLKILD